MTAIHHHHVVGPRSPRVAALRGDPWETLERERGILKGCDRTDVAFAVARGVTYTRRLDGSRSTQPVFWDVAFGPTPLGSREI